MNILMWKRKRIFSESPILEKSVRYHVKGGITYGMANKKSDDFGLSPWPIRFFFRFIYFSKYYFNIRHDDKLSTRYEPRTILGT